MHLNSQAMIERALAWGHTPSGPVLTRLRKVLNTEHPKGTNLLLEFLTQFMGWPYGAKNKIMDKVVDCAELPRIAYYIFFGIDIGSWSDAQYLNKSGKVVAESISDFAKCRPLTLGFYKTSLLKRTGHVTILYDSKRILHSGAIDTKRLVGFSDVAWGRNSFLCAKDFITDDQFNSLIAGGESVAPKPAKFILARVLKYSGDGAAECYGEDVKPVQIELANMRYYKGIIDGRYGPLSVAAVNALQTDFPKCGTNNRPDGRVGPKTTAQLGGVWKG